MQIGLGLSITGRGLPAFYPDATLALDFLSGAYRVGAGGASSPNFAGLPGLTVTRASTKYATTSSGLLVQFPSGVAAITDQGLLVEEARTNVALWCRDLTNAAWVKTNATAALDQVGADGTANSASSITATAGNATVLQAITLASSVRFQTAYVRRITGSGVVNMTTDGGATWTAITLTAGWTRVSIPSQTLANPSVGFQIVTNGDKIAVDFVQNENGAFATSPIPTTSAAATRAADVLSLGITMPATGIMVGQYLMPLLVNAASTREYLWWLNVGGSSRFTVIANDTSGANPAYAIGDGTTVSSIAANITPTAGQKVRVAAAFDSTVAQAAFAISGNAVQTVARKLDPADVGAQTLGIGGQTGSALLNSYLQTLLLYPGYDQGAKLQGLSVPQ